MCNLKNTKPCQVRDKKNETSNSPVSKSNEPVEFKGFDKPFGLPFHLWNIIILGILTHASIFYYLFYLWPFGIISRWSLPVGSFYGFLTAGLGTTVGAHRYWTHKTFKATKPLQYLLMLMQTTSFQYPIYHWCRDHRVHHKYTDTDADPHNAAKGFWFSHITWLFQPKHLKVHEAYKVIDMSDLVKDPVVRFQAKYYYELVILTVFIIPMMIFHLCLPEMTLLHHVVCSFTRFGMGSHITFLVNSFAHIWGNKPYDKYISPTGNKSVSFITLGEGWHNYHHTFPWDYKAAEFGGLAFNFSTEFIHLFARIGWAYDLKTVKHQLLVDRINRTGDVCHPLHKINREFSGDRGIRRDGAIENAGESVLEQACWGWGDKSLRREDVEISQTLFPLSIPG